ncbi:conserved hypothetical protein [Histoplasma capsulatum var. duboisii H88]|uniref:Uncharacterized protein n=1 Tax=Ajellomyces capsulatus (strain H88) TaxID=544711 RepID=F0UUH2_AJEC8|nr:conserved hypothetical protein [Histoplasma capsulatum var. duboisii H88]
MPPTIRSTSAVQIPPTPGTHEPDARSSCDKSPPVKTAVVEDVVDDVLAEYNAALAADPSLRSAAPDPEWEDYESILAKNPELMAPAMADRPKTFFVSKNKWECNHEGPEMPTDIENETAADGEDEGPATLVNECRGLCPSCLDPNTNPALKNETIIDGKVFYISKNKWECGHESDETRTDIEKDPLDIQSNKPSVLISEVRGICPTCMDRWHRLETGDVDGGAEDDGPASCPSSPPTYDEALEADTQYDDHNGDEEEADRLVAHVGLLDLDDGPTEGRTIERDLAVTEVD